MRSLLLPFIALLALLCCPIVIADTGTYELIDYQVDLAPEVSGQVVIDYYQKWRVVSGEIPWVTVGLPNRHYGLIPEPLRYNSAKVSPDNSGSWSGVRIDLDRSYDPGETFEIGFTIRLHRLLYSEDEVVYLDFTPGWYDRAEIARLEVSLLGHIDLTAITTDPPATGRDASRLGWSWGPLERGERKSILVAYPLSAFTGEITARKSRGGSGVIFGILIFSVLLFVALLVIKLSKGGGYGGGGKIGGAGKTGLLVHGTSTACACACVACACACACAGGGAAGCDRKNEHSCLACEQEKCKSEH